MTAEETTAAETTAAAKAASDLAATEKAAADKAVSDKAAADKAAADAAATAQGDRKATEPHVPESYALTLPEKSPLTGADLDRFRGEVKALGLTQDQAQKYVEAQNTATVAAIAQLQQEHEALKADPEIGGAKFDQSLAQAKRGMQELFGSDFEQATAFIDRLGLGNNLLLVRAFARFGAKFKEDRHVAGGGAGSPTQKTAAERMYPTMPAA